MSMLYLFISVLLMGSSINCEVQTQKVKDEFHPSRIGHLMSVDECFYLFVSGGKIDYGESQIEFEYNGTNAKEGNCDVVKERNVKEDKPANKLESSIKFDIKLNHTTLTSVTLNVTTLLNNQTEFWNINNITITGLGKEVLLVADHLWAPNQYSFSCGNFILHKSIHTTKNTEKNEFLEKFKKITFRYFQIQPFNGTIFMDSYDCEAWFTIGTFAGLLVLLLFTSILAIGIYYIMGIKANDRFEDPKGKPLVIGNTEG